MLLTQLPMQVHGSNQDLLPEFEAALVQIDTW